MNSDTVIGAHQAMKRAERRERAADEARDQERWNRELAALEAAIERFIAAPIQVREEAALKLGVAAKRLPLFSGDVRDDGRAKPLARDLKAVARAIERGELPWWLPVLRLALRRTAERFGAHCEPARLIASALAWLSRPRLVWEASPAVPPNATQAGSGGPSTVCG